MGRMLNHTGGNQHTEDDQCGEQPPHLAGPVVAYPDSPQTTMGAALPRGDPATGMEQTVDARRAHVWTELPPTVFATAARVDRQNFTL
jgi:hypothetical protein